MPDVRVLCAIGQRGQLGLGGGLPWEGESGKEYKDDVARFFMLTRGHVIMCGPRTARSFPDFAQHDRTIVELRSSMQPEQMIIRFPDRVIFIGGGVPVFAAYAHLIRHWDITKLPYDGEADCYFDAAWIVAADSRRAI
jgi:dihydromethanopterin reductase